MMAFGMEPDRIRVEEMFDWHRAGSNQICEVCGCPYWKHHQTPGYPWLRKLCDGALVKL